MSRRLPAALTVLLSIAACKEAPPAPGAAGSAAPSAPASGATADPDLLPAVEVTAPKPSYALPDLTDKQLERMVSKAGFTPTVVGKSPARDGRQSTVRVAAFKKTDAQQLEAVVFVRCRKPEDPPPAFPAGEAWYNDGACHMNVAVRVGIRNKTAESKRLLETLLAASAT